MSELVYYELKNASKMSPSLSTQVAREIGRRIVSGYFEPDSLLDDENSLAERYQVSRVVIRDAVKTLVSKGMLEVRRGVGTRVRDRHQWNMLDDDILAWHLSAPPKPELLRELMDIRLAFEPKAARWAAERATAEDLAAIEYALERMADAGAAAEDFVFADSMFHKAIIKAAHNDFLLAMEGVIYSALLISIRITNRDPRDNGASIPFHREVYNAIAMRDGVRAEQLIQNLLGDASRRLQSTGN